MGDGVRKRYLDVLKVGGAAAIVALHALSSTLNAGGGFLADYHIRIVRVLQQYLYVAVPIFMLSTGAGFLSAGRGRSYRKMARHIVKVTACILFFGSIFGGIRLWAEGGSLNLWNLCLSALTNRTWAHMWYLYRLLGVYFCMPLLSAFMDHADLKEVLIFAGLILFLLCLYPYAAGWVGFVPAEVADQSWIWIFYALVGGLLDRMADLRRYWRLCAAGTLLGAAGILWEGSQWVVVQELHPFQLIFAVSIFADVKLLCAGKDSMPWLAKLAQNTFGIYILHPVFIHVCLKIFQFNPQYHLPLLTLPLCISGFFACAAAVTMLLRKIPIVRKYLL